MLDILITIISLIILAFLWVVLYDSNRFVVTRYAVTNAKLKKNLRVVVLADLHNKRYGKQNERLLEAVEECRPDLILIAGDMLTAKPGAPFDTAVELVGALAANYPVYYGIGNHEHRLELYPEEYGDMGQRYEAAIRETGAVWLVNSHVTLEDYGIAVYGSRIDRYYYRRFQVPDMSSEYLRSILGQADGRTYNILLAHNPDYFPQYAAWGADLVCSGHVHGGVVQLPLLKKGVVSPSVRLFPKYDGGLFREGASTMILSRGLGMHTIPLRAFNPGEMILLELGPDFS